MSEAGQSFLAWYGFVTCVVLLGFMLAAGPRNRR